MFKQLFLWLTGSFILLQAIQIDIPEAPKSIDPKVELKAPTEIDTMFKTSCYDCHSYQTNIPWYGHISPLSLEVKSHIKNGRKALNFQEWENYSDERKQKIYKGIAKTINFTMPMPMYLMAHEEAKLSQKERKQIKAWAKSFIKERDL